MLNVKNGVLDLNTLKLMPHSPDYYFLHSLPVPYDPNAFPNKIMDFLYSVFPDDNRKIILALETFAYAFFDGYPIQKAIMFVGNGANGKSTLLSVLKNLLGEKNVQSMELQTLVDRPFLKKMLLGKLANIAADIGDKKLYNSGAFKALTGSDLVTAEVKYAIDPIQFSNTCKLFFSANSIPDTDDTTVAYFRRWVIIEFLQLFDTTSPETDENLMAKLSEESELAGLLNLLVRVFYPVLKKKMRFETEETIEETTQKYRLRSNSAKAFIFERVEVMPGMEMLKEDVYRAYAEWCKDHGIVAVSVEAFGWAIKQSNLAIYERQKQEDGIRKRFYCDFSLRSDESIESARVLETSAQGAQGGQGAQVFREGTAPFPQLFDEYLNKSAQGAQDAQVFSPLVQNCYNSYIGRRIENTRSTRSPCAPQESIYGETLDEIKRLMLGYKNLKGAWPTIINGLGTDQYLRQNFGTTFDDVRINLEAQTK
jgi:putative DNA primase/helicase